MEDSFRVRVDKVFGSLSESPSNSLTSALWSLTDEEIEKKEWTRDTPIRPYDDDDRTLIDDQRRRRLIASSGSTKLMESAPYSSASASASSNFGKELLDLQNLEDDDDDGEDEEDEMPSASSKRSSRHNRLRRASAPSDNNDQDDESEVRASIGQDCTLDYEEEEDEYDKVAVGKEKSGERLYMKDVNDYVNDVNDYVTDVNDYGTDVNSFHDPRANRLAAKLRLKEDSEAAGGFHSLKLSETSLTITNWVSDADTDIASPPDNIESQDDGDGGLANPKPILKSNKRDHHSVSKSHKRVRFEPQFDITSDATRDQNLQEASNLALTKTADALISSFPTTMDRSKYTHYTLDSSDDMDEESNSKAYMDFLNVIKKPGATEMQLDVDLSKPPTFTPRKSPMVDRESKYKQNMGGVCNDRTFPICIAAEDVQDNKVSAMEEDDSPVVDKGVYKSGRQYRTKSKIDLE